MSYYAGDAGDYYAGDYYAGDPLDLKGMFGRVVKGAAGFLTGGPIGAAAGLFMGGGRNPASESVAIMQSTPDSVVKRMVAAGGAAETPFGPAVGAGFGMEERSFFTPPMLKPGLVGGICNIKGHHLNKSTYITRGGGTSMYPRKLIVHPKGSQCVKIRRMNVANPRALRRALRRVGGFGKIVKRARRAVGRAASAVGIRRAARKGIARRRAA